MEGSEAGSAASAADGEHAGKAFTMSSGKTAREILARNKRRASRISTLTGRDSLSKSSQAPDPKASSTTKTK
jgi:hypothetical protein